jgi:hypothetical protein
MSIYPTLSASEKWWKHLSNCEVCCIAPSMKDAYLDRVCAIGSELRDASIAAYREANRGAA